MSAKSETLLQLRGFPTRLRGVIQREADTHRRSLTQEAIVLIEEAVMARAENRGLSRAQIDAIIDRYHRLPDQNDRSLDTIIEYDETGLPK